MYIEIICSLSISFINFIGNIIRKRMIYQQDFYYTNSKYKYQNLTTLNDLKSTGLTSLYLSPLIKRFSKTLFLMIRRNAFYV